MYAGARSRIPEMLSVSPLGFILIVLDVLKFKETIQWKGADGLGGRVTECIGRGIMSTAIWVLCN